MNKRTYWQDNLRLVAQCLTIWFICSFGFGSSCEMSSTGSRSADSSSASGSPSRAASTSSSPDLLLRAAHGRPRPTATAWKRTESWISRPSPTWSSARPSLLYIGIALATQASSTGEFYVAGKHVHPIANGMATAADWMSAASFISMAGLIAFLGYDGTVYLMGWTGGYVLLALLLAPYLRKFGKFTVPEFIGDRYDSQAARVVAVLCLIIISFTYIAGQMRGVGIVFSRFLAVDISARTHDRYGNRLLLRRARRNEGHHVYPGRAVLRADLRLHGAGRLHLAAGHGNAHPAARIRQRGRRRRELPAREARPGRRRPRLRRLHEWNQESRSTSSSSRWR